MNKMSEIAVLDKEIESLYEWILKAGNSLVRFYNSDKGFFWRDTFGMKNSDDKIHPTSTNRSFFSLYEFLRFLYEEDLQGGESWTKTANVLKNVVEKYLSRLPKERDVIAKSPDNDINMFTDSHLLMAISILDTLQRIVPLNADLASIRKTAETIAEKIEDDLKQWKGGKI